MVFLWPWRDGGMWTDGVFPWSSEVGFYEFLIGCVFRHAPPTVRIQLQTSEELNSPWGRTPVRLPSSVKAVYLPLVLVFVTINKSHHQYFATYTCKTFCSVAFTCKLSHSVRLSAGFGQQCTQLHPSSLSNLQLECGQLKCDAIPSLVRYLYHESVSPVRMFSGYILSTKGIFFIYLHDDQPLIWPIIILEESFGQIES